MLFPNRQSKSSWKPTALVIDKDADIHRSIHVMIGKEYDVHHAYFPRLALSLLEKRRFNVVFSSLDMDGADDVSDVSRTIRSISRDKGIPVIALGNGRSNSADDGESIGKSVQGEHLLAALRTALTTSSGVSGEAKG